VISMYPFLGFAVAVVLSVLLED
jgi:hypothetical protein